MLPSRLHLPVLCALLAACSPSAPPASHSHEMETGLHISDAWINMPPPGAAVAGAYLSLTNHGAEDRLLTVASTACERVEIHEMKMASGMMQMREITGGLALPANSTVSLTPGGLHLMLIAPNTTLEIGEQVEMHLTFEHARAQTVVFDVRSRMEADSLHGHAGQHHSH